MPFQITNNSASFTRPNDTNAYSIGDLVANSVTAGSVAPMKIDCGNIVGVGHGNLRLTRGRLQKSGTSPTNANFRIHLYQASPTAANGDNGAWSTDNSANWLGNIDVTSMLAFTDGCMGTGSAPAGSEIFARIINGSVFALLEAKAAYTPVANEVFTLTLEDVGQW